MEFTYFLYGNIMVLQLEGDLLGVSQESNLLALVNSYLLFGNFHCIVDLKRIHYMNSTGLSFLVRVLTALKQKQGKTILVNPNQQLIKLLKITKLDRMFTVASSQHAAIQLLT